MDERFEIQVTGGALKGKTFVVPAGGLRLGRSGSCEMSIPDPALSRNHCLFEQRGDVLWVTDLASANGTAVNGVELGAESRRLEAGDVVVAGDNEFRVARTGELAPPDVAMFKETLAPPSVDDLKVDLGLGKNAARAAGESSAAKGGGLRSLLWVAAAVAVAGAAAMILLAPDGATIGAEMALTRGDGELRALRFEKVEASAEGIYRYALVWDRDGELRAEIDDLPREKRHVRKGEKLSAEAVRQLDRLLASPEFAKLAPVYSGTPLVPSELKSFRLKTLRAGRVSEVVVENAEEPEAFREARERLEAFSKSQLGIWAIQYSAEKLAAMSAELRARGDAKWTERDVQHGNLAAAIKAYAEAVQDLETVDPKPTWFSDLAARLREAREELDRRYKDQRFLADRATNLKDWETARRELQILCEMVPDEADPRHAEAVAKLVDVEARVKKGGR